MYVDINSYICKITIIFTGNEKSMDYILMTSLCRQNVFLATLYTTKCLDLFNCENLHLGVLQAKISDNDLVCSGLTFSASGKWGNQVSDNQVLYFSNYLGKCQEM